MNIRIDKRVPMGFSGEWGRLYKLYNADVKAEDEIIYQDSHYRDIGQDIMLQCELDKNTAPMQAITNLVDVGESRTLRTGDAYFDGKQYRCIASVGDILTYENDYWVVESIDTKEIKTPIDQKIYKIKVNKIFDIERS